MIIRLRAAALALAFALISSSALAAGRVALVIGNGAYLQQAELPNPVNDANAMAELLSDMGFEVVLGTDLDLPGMQGKMRQFVSASRDADLALFFYAGHGIQVKGKNYLIPVDAEIVDEASISFETIDADQIFSVLGNGGRIGIALLDACRNNPYAHQLARSLGASRSADVGTGLAAPKTSGTGLFITFATAPDDVALDGTGANSPFTTAVLKHLSTPGLEINQVMTRVKADVQTATTGDQRPWTNSDLSIDVFLVPSATLEVADLPKIEPKAPAAQENEDFGPPKLIGFGKVHSEYNFEAQLSESVKIAVRDRSNGDRAISIITSDPKLAFDVALQIEPTPNDDAAALFELKFKSKDRSYRLEDITVYSGNGWVTEFRGIHLTEVDRNYYIGALNKMIMPIQKWHDFIDGGPFASSFIEIRFRDENERFGNLYLGFTTRIAQDQFSELLGTKVNLDM